MKQSGVIDPEVLLRQSFEQQLSGKYEALSVKLKAAADYVVANPIEVATRSLRGVARNAGLSPATFSRMSAALGYQSYEDLRDVLRDEMKVTSTTFAAGVDALQTTGASDGLLDRHAEACQANIGTLRRGIDQSTLETCVERLYQAGKVAVAGALGSASIADYLVYNANFISDRWVMVNHASKSVGGSIAGLTAKDVLIVITKPPFAAISLEVARLARLQGVFVIVITDTHTCPGLADASAHFIVPTRSPHFYSSYASTVVLCEIIIGMLAVRAGPQGRQRIVEVETTNRRLNEVRGG